MVVEIKATEEEIAYWLSLKPGWSRAEVIAWLWRNKEPKPKPAVLATPKKAVGQNALGDELTALCGHGINGVCVYCRPRMFSPTLRAYWGRQLQRRVGR
jgi:hypothetical protein